MIDKTTYIYLNHYVTISGDEYLYIGSHTWNGPKGQLDPNYHGTSHVAIHFGWEPYVEEILEVIEQSRNLVAEREWIEKYAEQYGIADCALQFSKSTGWTSQYKPHGKLLNLHSNSAYQMHTKEVYDKVNKSYDVSKRLVAAQKRLKSIDLKGSAKKAAQTIHIKSSWCNERFDLQGFIGTCEDICKEFDIKHDTLESAISRLRKNGYSIVSHKILVKEGDKKNFFKALEHYRMCRLNDGFVGNYKQIEDHTGLPHGTVTTAMTNAYKKGKFLLRETGWEFSKII